MIKVDIHELERLSDSIFTVATDADEVLNSLKKISAEMQEDIEFKTYIQSEAALESVSLSIEALNRSNDMLQTLKNVIFGALSEYQEHEKSNINALNRMIDYLNSIHTELDTAVSSGNITTAEITNDCIKQNKVQELVSGSVNEMQITNIAAITKSVEKEYHIKNIKDITESRN